MFTIYDFGTSASPFLEEIDAGDWTIQSQAHTKIGVLSGCAVTPSTGLGLSIAGGAILTSGQEFTYVGAGAVTLAAADPALYRFDLVGYTNTGTLAVAQGTTGVHPVFPAVPVGFVVLAAVLLLPAVTAITASYIVDKRVFVTGFAQMKSGTANIAQSTTSIVIAHGLVTTPTRVLATPQNNPGALWWTDTKTSTQFTIHLASAPGSGGVTFDWMAWIGDGS
jgi:hypothetical protein